MTSTLSRISVRGRGGVDAFTSAMTPYFNDPTFEFEPGSKDLTAQISIHRLKRIQIFNGRYKQAFRLAIPDARSFVQGFPSQGSGECANNGLVMQSSSGHGSVTEPGEMTLSFGPSFEHTCAFLDPNAVTQTLAGLVGAPPSGELRLDSSEPEKRSPTALSFRLLTTLIAELDPEEATPSSLVTTELEQAILVAFLCNTRHNYSRLLQAAPSGLAPRQVRRVEEYVEANWDQPVTIEALVIVANASARSIFHAFREHRGYSPMNLVKQVRLRHVREMLSNPNSEMSVTNAAFACGFGNLGHFATAYKKAFGESPSGTLARARGQLFS
jgi:AraC-like DNA-binding protein